MKPVAAIILRPLFDTKLIRNEKLKDRNTNPHFDLKTNDSTKVGNHFGTNHVTLDISGVSDDIFKVTPEANGTISVSGRDSKQPVVVGEPSGCAFLGLGQTKETSLSDNQSYTLSVDKAIITIHDKHGASLDFELLVRRAAK